VQYIKRKRDLEPQNLLKHNRV